MGNGTGDFTKLSHASSVSPAVFMKVLSQLRVIEHATHLIKEAKEVIKELLQLGERY